MKNELLQIANQEVYRRFPDFKGVRPKVREQAPATYLLTYQMAADLPGGKSLPRWVRLVITEAGKIQKVTTSR